MPMLQLYKDAEYFNSYFSKLENIRLIEQFKESDKKDENIFIGRIEFKETIHPLVVTIEIPKTFPHHKLKFWTKSLSGYPHLIYNHGRKESWFCLNTPFAETVDEQLRQELMRLNEWIDRQMRSDLPADIKDEEVALALKRANAYGWEVFDEIKEFNHDAMLTFIGDFGSDPKNFPERKGTLNCIKNSSNKMYVVKDSRSSNMELPYIIVDELPKSKDFWILKDQYSWKDDDCHHLLPEIFPEQVFKDSDTDCDNEFVKYAINGYPYEEAQDKIQEAKNVLKYKDIPVKHKECIDKKFADLDKELLENHKIKGCCEDMYFPDPDEDPEEYYVRQQMEDYGMEVYPFKLFYFAMGCLCNDKILWLLYCTQRKMLKHHVAEYNLGVRCLKIKELYSVPLIMEVGQHVDKKDFWGRGHLDDNLIEKNIAIIGGGAIGSILAESLVRSGVKKITLWDNDIVEPGNICRSIYTINDLGDSKVSALANKLRKISPFCSINFKGLWDKNPDLNFLTEYIKGEFYSSINYDSQEDVTNQLKDFDLIIDCTASNELLHFLSYALNDKDIISLCITNHAQELLCMTNRVGNIFEQRKMYLSKIEQDTKNYYSEGIGCYSPTFLANNCDIAALVNLAIRDINNNMSQAKIPYSTIWTYKDRGVVADRLIFYKLECDDEIILSVSAETLLDGEDLEDSNTGIIGYVLGGYSNDRKHIMISHFISHNKAEQNLTSIFNTSKGVIDYIGDFTYSFEESIDNKEKIMDILAAKAADDSINTNNPILALRNMDNSISFYLYIGGDLVKFIQM